MVKVNSNDFSFDAYFDSGSEINALTYDFYQKNSSNFETLNSETSIQIKGIGDYAVRSVGHFTQTVLVNEIPFTLTFMWFLTA